MKILKSSELFNEQKILVETTKYLAKELKRLKLLLTKLDKIPFVNNTFSIKDFRTNLFSNTRTIPILIIIINYLSFKSFLIVNITESVP